MRFKEFLYIFEALAPEVQAVLEKSKFPVAQDLVAQAIKDLNDDLDKEGKVITDKATAFKLLRQKLGLEKKPEVPEPTEAILKPFYKKLIDKEITLPEYKTAAYFKESAPNMLNLVMQELHQIIATGKAELLFTDGPQLVVGGENFSNFDDLQEFASKIHAIEASYIKKPAGFSEFRDPVAADLRHHGTMLWPPKGAKDNPSKIYIFKGDSFLKCKYFGKGAPWCVTKQPGYYYNYRSGGQTQFFVLDFNKAPDDPARYTNPGISNSPYSSEFVDLDNRPEARDQDGTAFGINGHESAKDYMSYLEKMGVPNPWELMKPDEVSKLEREFVSKMQDNNNLAWAREKGPQTVAEYLQALGTNEMHLPLEDFKTLSDKEKYDYMVETGLAPESMDEAMYLRSLSRKNYKEYLANWIDGQIDHGDRDRQQEIANFLLNIKSGKELKDEDFEIYGNYFAGTGRNYQVIGAGSNSSVNMPVLYLQYLKSKDAYDRTNFTVRRIWENMLVPELSDQKTPIKAYNFLMSNYDTFHKIDEDFIVNLIANDDFESSNRRDSEPEYASEKPYLAYKLKLNKNYINLKKMLYNKLDDAAKKRLFKELELYDEDGTADHHPLPDYQKHLDNGNKAIAKSLINNITELKKVVSLIGPQEWMSELPIYNNLTKEDHEWVTKNIGKKMFVKPHGFTQELARKHFTHADTIDNYTLRRYITDVGLEKTLQFLTNNKKDTSLLAKIDTYTYLNIIEQYSHELSLLLKYIPKKYIYSPEMMLSYLLNYQIASHLYENDKKNNYFFGQVKNYLSHADSSDYENLSKYMAKNEDLKKKSSDDNLLYGNNLRYLANYIRAKEDFPDLYKALRAGLPQSLYGSLLAYVPIEYLKTIVTPEWLKGEGKDIASSVFAQLVEKSISTYRRNEDVEKMLDMVLDISQPYKKATMEVIVSRLNRDSTDRQTALAMLKRYAENMPVSRLKDFIDVLNKKGYQSGRFSIVNQDTQDLLEKKFENLPFDMLADMFEANTSIYASTLLKNYLKTHDLSDEEYKTLFNSKIGRDDYLDVLWALEKLIEHNPRKAKELFDDHMSSGAEIKNKRVLEAVEDKINAALSGKKNDEK